MSDKELSDSIARAIASSESSREEAESRSTTVTSRRHSLVTLISLGLALALLLTLWEYQNIQNSSLIEDIERSAYDALLEADGEILTYFQANGEIPKELPDPYLESFVIYRPLTEFEFELEVTFYEERTIVLQRSVLEILEPKTLEQLF